MGSLGEQFCVWRKLRSWSSCETDKALPQQLLMRERHDTSQECRNKKKNMKTRQPFLKPLCLLLCKTIFFVDVGHCATECCHPLLAWWHKHSCTPLQLLCSSAPPLQSHRSGAVMLLGVSMGSFSGTALHIPGRYVGGVGKIMEVTIGCKSRKSSMVVMEGLHGVQLLSYGSLH